MSPLERDLTCVTAWQQPGSKDHCRAARYPTPRADRQPGIHRNAMSIIPSPIRCTGVSSVEATLTLNGPVTVSFSGEGADGVAGFLCAHLNSHLRLDSLAEPQEDASNTEGAGPIWLCVQSELESLSKLPNSREAYRLSSTDSGILIQAQAAHGLFNGVQTLLQLLPPTDGQDIQLENLQITDAPRFPWRGVLFDVGRHFFGVDFVKKVLDLMAYYKFNRFHWHLTEDQGWRIEVKQFPKLTDFGAWRGPEGHKYGGFYTQQQVKEIVAYAAERFIEVVPEIELPGHCCAALACYPNLSCTGHMTEVPDFWGVQEDVYCAGKEEVFHFLESVLTEVMELFPSQYIHIGGDECPKTRWSGCKHCQQRMREEGLADEYALQSWFISRINKFLTQHGKQIIGWDEILEGGISPGAIVMSWRGITGGVRAAKEGHQVIMTPTSHCYFDYRQSLRSDEPGAWFAMLPLEMVYDYDPVPPQPDYGRPDPIPEEEEYIDESAARDQPGGHRSATAEDGDAGSTAERMSDADEGPAAMSDEDPGRDVAQPAEAMSDAEGGGAEGEPGGLSMSRSSLDSGLVEQGDVVFSASMPVAFQGRPEDDWTLEARHAHLIIGGQANLWTEYIRDEGTVEYMLLPRLCAMSEALWSANQDRHWPSFLARLKAQLPHLDARGFQYRPLG